LCIKWQCVAIQKVVSEDGPVSDGREPSKTAGSDEVCRSLEHSGHLSPSNLARAQSIAATRGVAAHQVLSGLGFVTDDALAIAYSEVLLLPIAESADISSAGQAKMDFDGGFLERVRVFPYHDDRGTFLLGMVNPLDNDALRAVEFIARCEVSRTVMTPRRFEAFFEAAFGGKSEALDEVLSRSHGVDEGAALRKIEDQTSEAPIVRLVNRLITDAIEARASDIHVEPLGSGFRARMRVDGVLREVPVPNMSASSVLSRIKVLAGLDIAERRLPQDGRMSLAVRGRDVDFRVSTVPLMGGESVVMRILDRSDIVLDFGGLGFDQDQIASLENILAQPHGIILVTGPTGSGKTTTLYAALSGLNARENKILTIEDPIEFQLDGVNQSQVNSKIGHGFATALRSFLRQDPDIMMVGEIRDLETAEIAIQSSLTGHLVLSTLHTNDAIGSIARLMDLGAEAYLLSSTLGGLVAQRLVRKLCSKCCIEMDNPLPLLEGVLEKVPADLAASGFYEPGGCHFCEGTGFKGRQVIAEILPIDETLRTLISNKASEKEIMRQARVLGFRPMIEDGVSKAARSLTSLSEVIRVTQVF
jgi:general secretion pathway protein E